MKDIIKIYREGRYKRNSENNIDVDSHNVQRQIKKGRNIYICDCDNSSKFGNIQTCRHIKFFILLPFLDLMSEKARVMLMYYKVAKTQTKDSKQIKIYHQIIDDLNKFKEIDFR
jgi:hypothetical protein